MLRRTRQAVFMTMLILYGSVSFLGTGLHALSDIDSSHHGSELDDSGTGPKLEEGRGFSGHCALCEFQAQGQMATEPTPVVSRPHTSPHVSLILALVATRDRHPSSSPRAPPLHTPTVA